MAAWKGALSAALKASGAPDHLEALVDLYLWYAHVTPAPSRPSGGKAAAAAGGGADLPEEIVEISRRSWLRLCGALGVPHSLAGRAFAVVNETRARELERAKLDRLTAQRLTWEQV